MNEDEKKELVDIVAKLSYKYTSGESSSVTYETANQLMGAVMYCINEYRNNKGISIKCSLSKQYELGKELVQEKVKVSLAKYNDLLSNFNSYGNRNYQDTVIKAIAGFFQYYDVRYEPQNSIITCDYPIVISVFSKGDTGIDLIYKYIQYIVTEQKFLSALPEKLVINILEKFDHEYKNQFYNISTIVERNIIANLFIDDGDELDIYELKMKLKDIWKSFVQQFYKENDEIYEYFLNDIDDFAVRLMCLDEKKSLINAIKVLTKQISML